MALTLAAPVAAQHASIGYQRQVWSTDELRPFQGGLLRLGADPGAEFVLELGMSRWTDEGSTCVGLIFDPSDCGPEPLNVRSETLGIALGYSFEQQNLPGGRLLVTPHVGLVFTQFERSGRTTGRANGDHLTLADIGIAVRYATRPLVRDLFGAFVEFRVSAGKDMSMGMCADCFDPLSGGATRRSLLAGVSVSR